MLHNLTTGTGYVTIEGVKRYKFDLPAGVHPFPDGATITEISRAELVGVEVIPEILLPAAIETQRERDIDKIIEKAKTLGWC